MIELIGKECAIVFNLPGHEWPIQGYPAYATVEDVDMPMLKLSNPGSVAFWVNCSIIKTVYETK